VATRFSLTFDCSDPDRLAGLGATRLRVPDEAGVDHYFVVMQDPEGNEFCVV
jgi:hypothetical protein